MTVAAIQEAERALYAAMVAQDYAALERLVAPDAAYVHSTGVRETRKEYLAGVSKGLYDYESVSSRDTRTRVFGDIAVQDGVCEMLVGERGKPRNLIRLLVVLVWEKREGAWTVTHRHATRIP